MGSELQNVCFIVMLAFIDWGISEGFYTTTTELQWCYSGALQYMLLEKDPKVASYVN